MRNIFNFELPIMQFLSQVADLVVINILWILSCVPVITIGAGTTAMYRTTFAMLRDEGSLINTFFSSFRLNFKQSTFLWIIELLSAALIAGDLYLIRSGEFEGKLPLLVAFLISCLLFLFTVTYLYPFVAQFTNSSRNMLINAFMLSLKNLPKTLLMSALNSFPFLLLFFFPYWFLKTGFIWLLFGFSVIAYCNSLFLMRIFNKLVVS